MACPEGTVFQVRVTPGAKVGPPRLEAVELVSFEGLDHRCGVGRAGAAHRLEDLHHGCVAEVAARRGCVVVLVDHALDEPLRAFRVDLRIPDEAPDASVVRVSKWSADLLAAD